VVFTAFNRNAGVQSSTYLDARAPAYSDDHAPSSFALDNTLVYRVK
jgi:hypothetical protein